MAISFPTRNPYGYPFVLRPSKVVVAVGNCGGLELLITGATLSLLPRQCIRAPVHERKRVIQYYLYLEITRLGYVILSRQQDVN